MSISDDLRDRLVMRSAGHACRKLLLNGTSGESLCRIHWSVKDIPEEGVYELNVQLTTPIAQDKFLMSVDDPQGYATVSSLSKYW